MANYHFPFAVNGTPNVGDVVTWDGQQWIPQPGPSIEQFRSRIMAAQNIATGVSEELIPDSVLNFNVVPGKGIIVQAVLYLTVPAGVGGIESHFQLGWENDPGFYDPFFEPTELPAQTQEEGPIPVYPYILQFQTDEMPQNLSTINIGVLGTCTSGVALELTTGHILAHTYDV